MRVSIVLVIVLLPLWASLARAQRPPDQSAGGATPQSGQSAGGATQQSTPPGPTAVYPALNSQPFGTEHLLGDWGGARTWLEDHGIYVGLNYYPEVAAIVAGGQRQGIDYTSQIGLLVMTGSFAFSDNGLPRRHAACSPPETRANGGLNGGKY
jgi:hypothetical protein